MNLKQHYATTRRTKRVAKGRPAQRDVQQATKTIQGEMFQKRQEVSQELRLLVKEREVVQ